MALVSHDGILDGILKLFPDLESAQCVGREYLKMFPERAGRQLLLAELGLPRRQWNSASLLDWVAKEKAAQFSRGKTVVMRGWVLAQVEAQLCALTVV